MSVVYSYAGAHSRDRCQLLPWSVYFCDMPYSSGMLFHKSGGLIQKTYLFAMENVFEANLHIETLKLLGLYNVFCYSNCYV